MGECGALRAAGGAGGELDVDRLVELQAVAERLQGAATGGVVTLPFDDRGITLTGATFTAEGGKVRLAGTIDMAALLGTLGGE